MSMPRVRPSRVAFVLALLLVAVVDSGCQAIQGMYPPQAVTEQGTSIRNLYDIVFGIAVVIFLLVEGLIIYAVIRYRRKPTDTELPPQIHGNNTLEIIWTVIPMLIVGFLFFVSWQTLNSVEASSPKPDLKVRAVAGQFQWSFDYLPADAKADTKAIFSVTAPQGPDGGLFLPAGQTTHLFLHSPDVIHAFYVPQFLFKRDVVPGVDNQFDLEIPAGDAGQTYRGQCAELCGVGHRIMLFEVHALAPADFQAWYDRQVAATNATPAPAPSGAAATFHDHLRPDRPATY
jgi:cytochrome c oxidase subunit 2